MDYVNRENINSPWLITLSVLSLILTISVFLLIWPSLRKQTRSQNRSLRDALVLCLRAETYNLNMSSYFPQALILQIFLTNVIYYTIL